MIGSPFIGSEAAVAFLGIVDEYDPLRPNDYEAYMKQRKEDDRHRERDEDKWQREDDRDRYVNEKTIGTGTLTRRR